MVILEGTIRNGRIVFDEPVDLPEGTRVMVEVAAPDEVFEYPHPLAPYDRDKEIALLREAYEDVKAGNPGMPLERFEAEFARRHGLPPIPEE